MTLLRFSFHLAILATPFLFDICLSFLFCLDCRMITLTPFCSLVLPPLLPVLVPYLTFSASI